MIFSPNCRRLNSSCFFSSLSYWKTSCSSSALSIDWSSFVRASCCFWRVFFCWRTSPAFWDYVRRLFIAVCSCSRRWKNSCYFAVAFWSSCWLSCCCSGFVLLLLHVHWRVEFLLIVIGLSRFVPPLDDLTGVDFLSVAKILEFSLIRWILSPTES